MYTQTEKVNIEPKSYLPVFRISQNDVGRTLKAHLVSDEGTITIPTSATVTMAGIKPSGLGYTVTGTFDGSDVTFETDATMTDEAGQIESEIRIVDGETLNWSYDSNWHGFVATIADFNNPNAYNVLPNLICEKYETKVYNGTSPCITSWVGLGAHLVLIRDDNYTDATAFKTAMNGVQLCYELAEPQTYQLTPQTINTLSGVNNVWADSGDCSIEYYADTKLYIDKKLGGN